jgi:hypothetical protein
MFVLLVGCNGPSGGKKLATHRVIQDLQWFTDHPTSSPGYVIAAIAEAKTAGDPSRAADVTISIDLDRCVVALGLYEDYLDHTADKEIEQTAKDSLPRCIASLKRDSGND